MSDVILIADKGGKPVGGLQVSDGGQSRPLDANAARSILASRMALGNYGTQFNGDRDYYKVLGYPRTVEVEDYMARFDRDALGGRIVEFPADETWRDTPTVKDGADKEAKDDTAFAKAWATFAKEKRVYHYCHRVDILSGIGRFGVLLIGVAGSGELSTPVTRLRSINDVIYLRPYSEQSVTVKELETDPANPRYGLPRVYTISMADVSSPGNAENLPTRLVDVHYSRVIHVAEGLLENEVYGRPRLLRVINLLDDVLKVVGGSAEATWKLIRKGMLFKMDKDVTIEKDEEEYMQEQLDEYDMGLRRFLQFRGMDVADLGSQVVDPKGIFEVIISLISIATRIPKRILMGSERGELASSQDNATWAGHIASRQLNFAEQGILRPLIDRLIEWGALPKPSANEYMVIWDALFELTDKEKAEIAKIWAEAMEKAKSAIGFAVVSAEEFRGEFTPFADKLPPELEEARDQAKQAAMPAQGNDVLDQVAEVVSNHGLGPRESRAFAVGVARMLSKGY